MLNETFSFLNISSFKRKAKLTIKGKRSIFYWLKVCISVRVRKRRGEGRFRVGFNERGWCLGVNSNKGRAIGPLEESSSGQREGRTEGAAGDGSNMPERGKGRFKIQKGRSPLTKVSQIHHNVFMAKGLGLDHCLMVRLLIRIGL